MTNTIDPTPIKDAIPYTSAAEAAQKWGYLAFPVDSEIWESAKLGGEFRGGILVDGVYDQEAKVHLLIARFGRANGG